MKHETISETIEQELQRLREMEQRISKLPAQEFASAMAVVLQILAQASQYCIGTGFHINQTDAVAAVDRAQTYVYRLRDERDAAVCRAADLERQNVALNQEVCAMFRDATNAEIWR